MRVLLRMLGPVKACLLSLSLGIAKVCLAAVTPAAFANDALTMPPVPYGSGSILMAQYQHADVMKGLSKNGAYTLERAEDGLSRFEVNPGQQLFNLELRRALQQSGYGWSIRQALPAWGASGQAKMPKNFETAVGLEPSIAFPASIAFPDGTSITAPVLDLSTGRYIGPNGKAVDMQKLFGDGGAILPNLSDGERKLFGDLLQRLDELSPQERAVFDTLYKKGQIMPVVIPVLPPGIAQPWRPAPKQPRDSTCPNGTKVMPICKYFTEGQIPEWCECD